MRRRSDQNSTQRVSRRCGVIGQHSRRRNNQRNVLRRIVAVAVRDRRRAAIDQSQTRTTSAFIRENFYAVRLRIARREGGKGRVPTRVLRNQKRQLRKIGGAILRCPRFERIERRFLGEIGKQQTEAAFFLRFI